MQALVIVAIGVALGFVDRRAWDAKLRPDGPAAGSTLLAPPPPKPPKADSDPPGPDKPTTDTQGQSTVPKPGSQPPKEAAKPGDPGWTPTAKDALKDKPGHLTLQEALDQHTFQQATFLDARNHDEFVAGHIPGAHLAPLSAFREGTPPAVLATLPKESPIIVYCSGGDCEASEDVQLLLQQAGHVQVFIIHDGFPGWSAMKYPVETGEPKP